MLQTVWGQWRTNVLTLVSVSELFATGYLLHQKCARISLYFMLDYMKPIAMPSIWPNGYGSFGPLLDFKIPFASEKKKEQGQRQCY